MRNTTHKSDTIYISKEAYLYLLRISRKQRGCKPLDEIAEERIWNKIHKVGDKFRLDDQSLGGGDGTYKGKWWSWSVDTVKTMLTEAGFEYEEGEPIEYILVDI